jgi:hypothetical protein
MKTLLFPALALVCLGCSGSEFSPSDAPMAGAGGGAGAAGSGGSAGAPAPSIACPHGVTTVTGVGPGLLADLEVSALVPYEPHDGEGDTRPRFIDLELNSESLPGHMLSFEDLDEEQMAMTMSLSALTYPGKGIQPGDTLRLRMTRRRASAGSDEPLEPTACSVFLAGGQVATWP